MTKILLVDDRQDNLMSIESILESAGYQFIKASSGRQALKILLSELDFALILMDVKMPDLNGFETAALIYEREKLRHIPIIFLSAHNYGEENVFKGYRAGAVDYIYKPINPDLLRAKVSVFVELYRKTHQLMLQEQKLIDINKSLLNEINEHKMSEKRITSLNMQLIQNIDKLEAANRDLDRFAFMASHDLQEPLRKIRTFTERLQNQFQESLTDDGKRYIDRIQTATERLQVLIRDIMTFSRISIEKGVFVHSDLNVIVHDALGELEELVAEKQARITVAKLPTVIAIPTLMRPLFYNLIHNSLKYSKSDTESEIQIYCDSVNSINAADSKSSKNKYCRIFVKDNGIGFEQKYADQIFEMFKRLHHHNEYEGTGIGLALCKKIMDEHNGFISAQSALDKGATFIISLPIHVETSELLPVPEVEYSSQ